MQEQPKPKKRYLDYREAAEILDVSVPTLRRLVGERLIKHYRTSRQHVRFLERDLENYMKKFEVGVAS